MKESVPLEGDAVLVGRKINSSFDVDIELVVEKIEDRICSFLKGPVVVLCGEGTSGKKARRLGEKLLLLGYEVTFCTLKDSMVFPKGSTLIEGLLGLEFQGKLEVDLKAWIEAINAHVGYVISLDLPSGIYADTGCMEGVAVKADLTLVMGVIRACHLYNEGIEHVGKLEVIDCEIEQGEVFGFLVNPEIVKRNLPKRRLSANKYTVGQVLLVAGSQGMSGAAFLAAKAALRSGAGIVKLFHSPGMEYEGAPLELVKCPYTDEERLSLEWGRTKAVVLGMGLGRSKESLEIVEEVFRSVTCPIVVDGDGLFFFRGGVRQAILTPHQGEMKHLLGVQGVVSDLELIAKAEQFVDEHDVVIVLKGKPTTVIAKGFSKVIIPYGNSGMASAGMGDVLSGIIGAFLAQGKGLRESAILGATVHAMAGDLAKEETSVYGLLASDLIEVLPKILKND